MADKLVIPGQYFGERYATGALAELILKQIGQDSSGHVILTIEQALAVAQVSAILGLTEQIAQSADRGIM